MKNIAELLQERRRRRRTIVEFCPQEGHQSNEVLENAHVHLEGLLRTMRSRPDGKERCERECEIAVGTVVGQTLRVDSDEVCNLVQTGTHLYKRQRTKDYAGTSVTESRFESQPRWNQHGNQRACSWEIWTCLTTLRRHDDSDEFQQINNGIP